MSEENGGTARKAGWSCLGCGVGMVISLFLVLGLIGLALYGLGSAVSSGLESSGHSSSPYDPDNLEEEYLQGKRGEDVPKIAVVKVHGVIASDDEACISTLADPRYVCLRIRRAGSDPKVKALVIDLNTPGGEVVASDEIYEEIRRFRKKTGKPAIAMMNTIAASGGYYIASACNPIVANKLTMTGSIGVIISTCNYRGLFEKIGLQSEVYTSGKMKDMLNGGRARTPEEVRIVQKLIDGTYREFVRIVAESRKIPAEKIMNSEIGDGRIFDGVQAKQLGLVDTLGYFRDAVEIAAGRAKLKPGSYQVIGYKEPFSFSRMMALLSSRGGSVPLSFSLNGNPANRTFVPKPGMLYYLPAGY